MDIEVLEDIVSKLNEFDSGCRWSIQVIKRKKDEDEYWTECIEIRRRESIVLHGKSSLSSCIFEDSISALEFLSCRV